MRRDTNRKIHYHNHTQPTSQPAHHTLLLVRTSPTLSHPLDDLTSSLSQHTTLLRPLTLHNLMFNTSPRHPVPDLRGRAIYLGQIILHETLGKGAFGRVFRGEMAGMDGS